MALLIAIWQLRKEYIASFSGEWLMKSEIQKADSPSYVGMELEWKLHLFQKGKSIEGTGEKIKVNGVKISYSERTSIDIKGTIKGDNFTLQYIENGKNRKTTGTFTGKMDGGEFTGKFSQTASDSQGTIKGRKLD